MWLLVWFHLIMFVLVLLLGVPDGTNIMEWIRYDLLQVHSPTWSETWKENWFRHWQSCWCRSCGFWWRLVTTPTDCFDELLKSNESCFENSVKLTSAVYFCHDLLLTCLLNLTKAGLICKIDCFEELMSFFYIIYNLHIIFEHWSL